MAKRGGAIRYNKRDENENDIIAAMLKYGVWCWECPPGFGCDLYASNGDLIEVKMPGKHLTENEEDFQAWCLRHGRTYRIFYTETDVRDAYKQQRS